MKRSAKLKLSQTYLIVCKTISYKAIGNTKSECHHAKKQEYFRHGPYFKIYKYLIYYNTSNENLKDNLWPRIKWGHTSTSLERWYGPSIHFPNALYLPKTIEIDKNMN